MTKYKIRILSPEPRWTDREFEFMTAAILYAIVILGLDHDEFEVKLI
jgi:hypothetical protein